MCNGVSGSSRTASISQAVEADTGKPTAPGTKAFAKAIPRQDMNPLSPRAPRIGHHAGPRDGQQMPLATPEQPKEPGKKRLMRQDAKGNLGKPLDASLSQSATLPASSVSTSSSKASELDPPLAPESPLREVEDSDPPRRPTTALPLDEVLRRRPVLMSERRTDPPALEKKAKTTLAKKVINLVTSGSTHERLSESDIEIRIRASKKPIECTEAANANAFAAFDMSMQEAMESLRMSDFYWDASTLNPEHTGLMVPGNLEGMLWQLLKEPEAREMVVTYALSPPEAVAIRFYGREGFQNVQPALRGIPDPALGVPPAPASTFTNLVMACCSGLEKLPPLPADTTLFRGTNFFDKQAAEVYADPAFVSTSLSIDVATGKFEGQFLLKFEVAPGAACRDISRLTGNSKEAEVLFPPDTIFSVEAISNDGDRQLVTLRPHG